MRSKRIIATLLILAGTILGNIALAQPAMAQQYNPVGDACSRPEAQNSAACQSTNSAQFTGRDSIIIRVTRLIATIAGVAAVIAIIIYGLQMVFSNGDTSRVATARNGIIAAAVGLVVIFLSQAIVVFLVRNL